MASIIIKQEYFDPYYICVRSTDNLFEVSLNKKCMNDLYQRLSNKVYPTKQQALRRFYTLKKKVTAQN